MRAIRILALAGILATSRPGFFLGCLLVCELVHILCSITGLVKSDSSDVH